MINKSNFRTPFFSNMKQPLIPAPIRLAGQRASRGLSPGDQVYIEAELDLTCESEVPQVGKCAGAMRLKRVTSFEVSDDGAAIPISDSIEIISETMKIGAEYKPHQETCGHPLGCGEPCNWCSLVTRHTALLLSVANALRCAASGDVDATIAAIRALSGEEPTR